MTDLYILITVFISIILVVVATSRFKLNAFFALLGVSLILALATLDANEVIPVLKTGFGNTLASIGLIIIFGTTLGVLLDKSGATIGMASFILRFFKKEKASRAMLVTGCITGMPIFCDSGFIVLSGLNKSLSKQSGISIVRMSATLAISLFTLHCFIPPHPGITAAAGILDGSIGYLVLFGLLVAIPGVLAGYVWIGYIFKRTSFEASEIKDVKEEIPANIPSPFKSFFPVILPLLLISLKSFTELSGHGGDSNYLQLVNFLGDPVMALLAGVISGFILFPLGKLKSINNFLVEAIEKAGPILIITAAGGTFGAVIKATGIGGIISEFVADSHLGLFIPFLIAVLLKTAQGSSTVAAITAASIVAPMIGALQLDSEMGRIITLLAIGAGTLTISHANDSYFWVVSRFSGLSTRLTLRMFSSTTIVVSIVSILIIYLLSVFLI
jgi:gluconate:H+ symporter, GntP family